MLTFISHAANVIYGTMAFIKVAKVSEIATGKIKGFLIENKKIAIANTGGKLYAFEDRCPHQSAKLSFGTLVGNNVMCKAHGEQFSLETGKPVMMLTPESLKLYAVRVEGEDILVDI